MVHEKTWNITKKPVSPSVCSNWLDGEVPTETRYEDSQIELCQIFNKFLSYSIKSNKRVHCTVVKNRFLVKETDIWMVKIVASLFCLCGQVRILRKAKIIRAEVGLCWRRRMGSSSVITPEDVLESLMNDGTIDSLRLKIINQLKANVILSIHIDFFRFWFDFLNGVFELSI